MITRNLNEQLLHILGQEILNEKLLPGDVLPSVELLSEMKGVSRTVVREALKGLSARRLILSSTKIGTVVQDRNEWQWWDPDVLTWALQSENNRKFLLQLSDVRLAVEPAAVRLAAKNASDQDLKQIQRLYENLEKSLGDEEKWAKADYDFHKSILQASHNELMYSLVNTLHTVLVQSRHTTIQALKNYQDSKFSGPAELGLFMHKEVMEAVCSRNESLAYEKMYDLLLFVIRLIEK